MIKRGPDKEILSIGFFFTHGTQDNKINLHSKIITGINKINKHEGLMIVSPM